MKAMILLCFCLIIASCSPYGFNPMGYEIKNENLDEAWKKVAAMKYIPESDDKDYWKSPTEFYADGGGDCEDFSAALIYELGPEASAIVYCTHANKEHCIVYYHDLYIEPQTYGMIYRTIDINYIFTYAEIMEYCTNSGKKSL